MAVYNPFRCSLIENRELTLYLDNLPKEKNSLLKDFIIYLQEKYKYEHVLIDRNKSHEIVLYYKNEIEPGIYVLELAQNHIVPIDEKREKEIAAKNVSSYPPSKIIFDLQGQIFIIKHDQKSFSSTTIAAKWLGSLLDSYMSKFDYHVILEPIGEKCSFWAGYEEFDYIKSVEFDLIAPNIFGANLSATEFLNKMKRSYNSRRTKITLENEDESLQIDQSDPSINSATEYVEHGGGAWQIKGRLKNEKKIRSMKSNEKQKKIVLYGISDIDKLKKEIEDMNEILKKKN